MLFQWYLIGISMVFQWYSRHIQPTYLGYLGVAVVVLVIGCMYIYIYSYMMLYVQPYYMTIGIVRMLITMGMPSYNPNCKKLFWNVLDGWFLQDLDISPGT
jgi:hypothetical protein